MVVQTGTFTVVSPRTGNHRTVRIRKADPNFFSNLTAGTLIAQYMSGSDNESSFSGFGFVTPDGRLVEWNRHKTHSDRAAHIAAVEFILRHGEQALEAGKVWATKSSRCWRCARKLTVPVSIHNGLGPDCAAQVGIEREEVPISA